MRRGLSAFTLVGLPDRAVRESRERVRAALLNSGPRLPAEAHHREPRARRTCARRDRASTWRSRSACWPRASRCPRSRSAAPRCAASSRSRARCGRCAARSRPRWAPAAADIAACWCRRPTPPRRRSSRSSKCAASRRCGGSRDLLHGAGCPSAAAPPDAEPAEPRGALDLADVRGQDDAKRALEVAAAGGHNLLMIGPPGAGKTMLARRLPGMLPPPTFEEALEVTLVHSAAGIGGGAARHRAALPRPPPHDLAPGAGRRRQPPPCRARSRWPTAECCSWTSCRSSAARRWTPCASRWRTGG